MKAVLINEPGSVRVVDREKPQTGPGEVLLKITYVGLCGSDLKTYKGGNPLVSYPRVPGHEIAGTVVETGAGVPGNFKKGMAVTVIPYTSCGNCPSCRNGRSYACQYNQTLGVQRDGAMCEYIALPWEKLITAENLTDKELALVEPLTVGFHAVDRGRVTDNDTVIIFGCGMIGIGAIIRSVVRGANVIAVDIDDGKLELAKKIGAKYTINSIKENLHDRVSQITSGRGPDVAIEAVGHPLTYTTAVKEIAFTGRVVCIGYAKEDVTFTTQLFVQKEMDILGSRNASPADFRAVVNYLGRKVLPVDDLISHVVTFDGMAEAIKNWAANPGKIVKILIKP